MKELEVKNLFIIKYLIELLKKELIHKITLHKTLNYKKKRNIPQTQTKELPYKQLNQHKVYIINSKTLT